MTDAPDYDATPTEWRHARWVEIHTPSPGVVHLRGEHENGADRISTDCATCGEVLLPARIELPEVTP